MERSTKLERWTTPVVGAPVHPTTYLAEVETSNLVRTPVHARVTGCDSILLSTNALVYKSAPTRTHNCIIKLPEFRNLVYESIKIICQLTTS